MRVVIAVAVLMLSVACGGADSPTVVPPGLSSTQQPGTKLAYDPASFTCPGAPRPVIDRQWQTSAPRQPVKPATIVEVGLRNKLGGSSESYDVQAVVRGPDVDDATASAKVRSDAWTYVHYPQDFTGGKPTVAGTYTFEWRTSQGFLVCDGFVVS